ncbi:MAG TPA: GIY-YIG nuclease family protein [Alphaproteobacteria bacterium]|nr:GIY-YIG nuclease family protein [Alphaproteobacteria bacterium]
MNREYYVYIITNRPNGILYVGVTSNLSRRMYEHQRGLLEGFSKKYGLKLLVYYENYPTPAEAIQAETRMKKWNRAWKVRRILEVNPEWKDLSKDLAN